MIMRLRFVGILCVIYALLFTSTVYAHATEPRLEINIDRIIPGGVIDVRGVGFDYEEVVRLTLIGSQGELDLGEVTADLEGIFLNIVTLPSDLLEGTYYFRGVTTHHYTISPPLTVQGTAILDGEDQEARDWDDVMLAPMPTFVPGVVPGSPPQQPAPTGPAQELPTSSSLPSNMFILAVLMVFVIILLFGMLRRRLR